MAISLKVNGVSHSVPAEPDTPLLYVFAMISDLTVPNLDAAWGSAALVQCLLDGDPTRSCVTPLKDVGRKRSRHRRFGTIDKPHPLQRHSSRNRLPNAAIASTHDHTAKELRPRA